MSKPLPSLSLNEDIVKVSLQVQFSPIQKHIRQSVSQSAYQLTTSSLSTWSSPGTISPILPSQPKWLEEEPTYAYVLTSHVPFSHTTGFLLHSPLKRALSKATHRSPILKWNSLPNPSLSLLLCDIWSWCHCWVYSRALRYIEVEKRMSTLVIIQWLHFEDKEMKVQRSELICISQLLVQ